MLTDHLPLLLSPPQTPLAPPRSVRRDISVILCTVVLCECMWPRVACLARRCPPVQSGVLCARSATLS